MATLIPSFTSCVHRMTSGERRVAERLEQKLDDDYLIWYDVPVGPKQSYPDFVVLHPRRGILILETKDWRLDTVQEANTQEWEIFVDGKAKRVVNPLSQARHCAIEVVNALERDAALVHAEGSHKGKLLFPWGYGVVLSRITRKQFETAGLGGAIPPHRVICSDEMQEACDAEEFQARLWAMFPHMFRNVVSLPNLERVRWILFPQVRLSPQLAPQATQASLFDDNDPEARLPDVMRVMDLQQEQLARSLGDGHRVIHGVAGSGKTMILGYRAEYLARVSAAATKPILVLCYNEPLAVKLAAHFVAKGLEARVHVRHFHRWCYQQLQAYGQTLPRKVGWGPEANDAFFAAMVQGVIDGVSRSQIPSGQYQAIMIDEGHDFRPEWLKLITQMVDPSTNSLLVLYDDAQSIYERRHSRQFSFKSVGIQAQGRTTILKINYRNNKQILALAHRVTGELLAPEESAEDGVPLIRPMGCGREGEEPLVIRLPSLKEEARKIAELLKSSHKEGYSWQDMAVLCPDHATMYVCANALSRAKLPHHVRKGTGDFRPAHDSIRVMTIHASKGLEFQVVALAGVGNMATQATSTKDAETEIARLFYVAATRATTRLLVTVSGDGVLGQRLAA
jgi:hypothetical protein